MFLSLRRLKAFPLGIFLLWFVLNACAQEQTARLPEPDTTVEPEIQAPEPQSPPSIAAPPPNGRMIVDARQYPWSAMGRLNNGTRRFCNAMLIAEDLILTQASCLYDGQRGQWRGLNELYFQAGYQRDDQVAGSRLAEVSRSPEYDPTRPASFANQFRNWAFARLEQPIG